MADTKYINAEELLGAKNAPFVKIINLEPYIKLDDLIKMVDNQPAADVQPVVHCKDCKYRNNPPLKELWCYSVEVEDSDFCSCGAKMEEQP